MKIYVFLTPRFLLRKRILFVFDKNNSCDAPHRRRKNAAFV